MNTFVIERQLLEFLISVTGNAALSADSDLLDAGIADSLTMMDLLVFIESEYRLRLDFTDLNPEVFRTPQTIAKLIAARTQPAAATIAA